MSKTSPSGVSAHGEIEVQKVEIVPRRGEALAEIYEMGIVEGSNPAGCWPRCEYCRPEVCTADCHKCRARWLADSVDDLEHRFHSEIEKRSLKNGGRK